MPKTRKTRDADAPPPMRPTLHMDLEEIEGAGDAEIGDTWVLEVTAQIQGLSKMMGPDEEEETSVTFEIRSVRLLDREVTKPTVDPERLPGLSHEELGSLAE